MNGEAQKRRPMDRAQRLYLTLLFFTAALLASALVVFHNNSTRTFSIFIFLLFFGVGILLLLGLMRGTLVGLLMISAWIAIKQLLGVWEEVRLLDNLLELLLAGLTFIFSGLYHDRLQAILNSYRVNQNRLRQLDLEDRTVGLLKPSVGMLRLNEEEERSIRYRRPFALLLIMVRPDPESDLSPQDNSELMRAIATSVKDTTRETDIPFLAANSKIAVILPETETSGANKVVNNILNRMTTTTYINRLGVSRLIQTHAHLRFGFAAFQGISETKIDLMEAAERSLQRSLEINSDDLFQNIFIEWMTVGEVPVRTPLLEEVVS